ncbi:2-hydroxyacid dehydrogenase [Novosphingobium sp. ST904]|uniref:2-hydroxyacid dehydrogenase n=1 Tax=Novosphingobium sp. ST904 TaxID=1684385 RepID=UPI0006C8BDA0|nr:2-hydroxyacid dehydrogenase [Novosphingobium sp. ST904]KPH66389.1 2-hydroxyacid dehydrogenase [Novosphingobium sp. ST904]TCM29991.1 D-lactate dehydrogenase [Novosphingobium sp. ST904]
MKVAVFSTRPYDREFLDGANELSGSGHELFYLEMRLNSHTAHLAAGHDCICAFVNDQLGRKELEILAANGTRLIALRSAGFNNVDLDAARELGLGIGRVPAYSPDAIAEHAVALILSLNRKIHKAYARVREGNFALEGLLGFDLKGKVAGVIGTGKIGINVARILRGFGCEVLASDPFEAPELGALGGRYVPIDELLAQCDIISLHCPLTPTTRHLIDRDAIAKLKSGAMLINTSRGAVMDARAVIAGLKSGKVGYVGLDVYEEEEDLFFEDLSEQVIRDDVFVRLMTFPNVLITGHQGFFTREAMTAIAGTTISNITAFEKEGAPLYPVQVERRG